MANGKHDPLWFKDAIIYELSVRAFFDGNGDGIGDFQGLIQKLDYLEDLGVNTLITATDEIGCRWIVMVELVELRRIPDSTDVLGVYAVALDEKGELREYRRTNRYYRSQVEEA